MRAKLLVPFPRFCLGAPFVSPAHHHRASSARPHLGLVLASSSPRQGGHCGSFFIGLAFAARSTPLLEGALNLLHFGLLAVPFCCIALRPGSEVKGQITVGGRDPRITGIGYLLRKTKLDELPQLWNVLIGDMSIVGPRPEVPKYVAMYTAEQRDVLRVRPGITSLASIAYINENELLSRSNDPERTYVEEVMPAKLALDLRYVRDQSVALDLHIIVRTLAKVFIPGS
ncbi:MAG: sugar transferase [Flavobacteriales bacterium]|nr:sugar transferase [Flavobacteriales bacterium]